jgi:non-canonical purine NTP pyrophosphatase (RdgB/HAM1 family)
MEECNFKKYIFATGNTNKFQEVQRILGKINPNIIIEQYDIVTYDEIQGTPEEISINKTKKIVKEMYSVLHKYEFSGLFTEDISLHCDGLYGMPGPYIKDALKTVGIDNLSKLIINTGNTTASAMCYYTLYKTIDIPKPSRNTLITKTTTVQESAIGDIVIPRGQVLFGFDPIFQVKNQTQTFAEMSDIDKDKYSHRKLALIELNKLL